MGDANIWKTPGPNSTEKGMPPVKLIASKQHDGEPRFSPDGKWIAFTSNRKGSDEIWVCDSQGHNAVQITSFNSHSSNSNSLGSLQWSPDGRSIAFDATKEGNADIYIVNSAGGPVHRLTMKTSDELRPAWSRDGQWIYFGSNRSGDWQIWKMRLGGGAAMKVTKRGGRDALESDGKFLYYAKLFGHGIWRVPVEGGEEMQVLDQGEMSRWTLTGQGIFSSRTVHAARQSSSTLLITAEFLQLENSLKICISTMARTIRWQSRRTVSAL
jgi:Tol biopolymer transport system component